MLTDIDRCLRLIDEELDTLQKEIISTFKSGEDIDKVKRLLTYSNGLSRGKEIVAQYRVDQE